jgi:hypothetical protein
VLGTKVKREMPKDIAKEPEMIRIKELSDTGQESPDRPEQYVKDEGGQHKQRS